MDVESLAKQLILQNMTPEQQNAVLESVRASLQEARNNQKRRVSENVGMVVDALKKIEADIRAKYDDLGGKIEARVNSIRDGRDGADGRDGKDGRNGRDGKDGAPGPMGPAGRDGRDGLDGQDGVSVTDAKIDFDGSLVISLSNGREINVGEVVAPDLAERIKVITNGGGTSQTVIDTLASLQQQIDDLIPDQTGNAGKFLTTNGSVLSWANVAGGLSYQGTWNAATNTPTLTSSVGTNGYYYIVATAGSTNLNGITDWQVGDWLMFNGTVWQKIDQSDVIQTIASADNSITVTTTGPAVDLATYSSPRLIAQVRNETGATLTKGTVVYVSGAAGNKATVSKAIATSDNTSAQTFGLIQADIANNNNGYAILAGNIDGLDTSAFAAGTQLYLSSTTAGGYTSTKQYAPNHLVYVGVVTRSHATQGSIEVRIQNGYEMDELHNVSAQNPSDGQVLIYNATTSLWEKNTLTAGTGINITEGAGSITIANTGVTSATAGTGISVSASTGAVTITNTAPDQTVSLTGAGTTSVSGTYPNFTITSNDQYTGTVTSVAGTGTVNGISLSGTVTSSGSLTLGGALTGTASLNINGSVGATTPSTGAFTNLSYTGTLTGGTGVINIGSGQVYKDVSGNVGIGTSSPSFSNFGVSSNGIEIKSSLNYGLLKLGGATGEFYVGSGQLSQAWLWNYSNAPMVFATSNTERMRIDASGNLGIGTSSPATKADIVGASGVTSFTGTSFLGLQVRGATSTNDYSGIGFSTNGQGSPTAKIGAYFSGSGSYLQFGTSNSYGSGVTNTAMTIDFSGNLLVGTTSASGRLTVNGSGTSSGAYSLVSNDSAGATLFAVRNDGALQCNKLQNFTSASAANIYYDGTYLYKSTSSVKYKKNVQDSIHGLDDLLKLRSVTYEGKSENDAGKTFGGLIAEEVHEAGMTEFVQYAEDGTPDALAYGNMVSLCIKAIQEQQAMIEELKAKVAALEVK